MLNILCLGPRKIIFPRRFGWKTQGYAITYTRLWVIFKTNMKSLDRQPKIYVSLIKYRWCCSRKKIQFFSVAQNVARVSCVWGAVICSKVSIFIWNHRVHTKQSVLIAVKLRETLKIRYRSVYSLVKFNLFVYEFAANTYNFSEIFRHPHVTCIGYCRKVDTNLIFYLIISVTLWNLFLCINPFSFMRFIIVVSSAHRSYAILLTRQ